MNTETEIELIEGEEQKEIITRIRVRRECEVCGELANQRHTYLLPNARRNPASSGYGGDDISRCSDKDAYTCQKHTFRDVKPDGYEWCGTHTLAKGNPHMFLQWHTIKTEKVV